MKHIKSGSLLLISIVTLLGCHQSTAHQSVWKSTNYVCVSDFVTSSDMGHCRAKDTLVQQQFQHNVGDLIESSIASHKYLISIAGLTQPTNVIPGWNQLADIHEKAQKLSDYGFDTVQKTLNIGVDAWCKDLESTYKSQCMDILLPTVQKDPKRIEEKAGKGVEYVFDVSIASVVLNYRQIPQFLEIIHKQSLKNPSLPDVKFINNRLYHPTALHYRDVQVLLIDQKTGFISELLILGQTMEQEKDQDLHKLYEEVRKALIVLDALKKQPQTPENLAKIKELEHNINEWNAQSIKITDNIFRKDAVSSCAPEQIKNCEQEIAPYIEH